MGTHDASVSQALAGKAQLRLSQTLKMPTMLPGPASRDWDSYRFWHALAFCRVM